MVDIPRDRLYYKRRWQERQLPAEPAPPQPPPEPIEPAELPPPAEPD